MDSSTCAIDADILSQAFEHDPILDWWQGYSGVQYRHQMFFDLSQYANNCLFKYKMFRNGTNALAICQHVETSDRYLAVLSRTATTVWAYRHYVTFSHVWRLIMVTYILVAMQPRKSFLHFQYLAVSESVRRQGIGAQLVNNISDYATAKAVTCYFETGSKPILEYFEKRGWQISSTRTLPGGGPVVWGLCFTERNTTEVRCSVSRQPVIRY